MNIVLYFLYCLITAEAGVDHVLEVAAEAAVDLGLVAVDGAEVEVRVAAKVGQDPGRLEGQGQSLDQNHQNRTRMIRHFSCSTQLNMKFILLINVKIPTLVYEQDKWLALMI